MDNAKELQIAPVLLKPCVVVVARADIPVTFKPPELTVKLLAKYPVP